MPGPAGDTTRSSVAADPAPGAGASGSAGSGSRTAGGAAREAAGSGGSSPRHAVALRERAAASLARTIARPPARLPGEPPGPPLRSRPSSVRRVLRLIIKRRGLDGLVVLQLLHVAEERQVDEEIGPRRELGGGLAGHGAL